MKSNYLSIFWWFLLPKAVGWIQWFYYSIVYRAGDPKPQPGHPHYVRHYRRIYTGIVVIYMLFTVYQADWSMQREGNLYSALGVPVTVEESGIKSRFRTLTRLYHPDKVSTGDPEAAQNFYMALKDARDALADPIKRYVYDRLGPDILTLGSKGKGILGIKEYVYHASITTILPYHAGTVIVLFVLNLFGYFNTARYWRFYTVLVLAAIEVHILTRPSWPSTLTRVINPALAVFQHRPLLPFELIQLLRTTAVSLFIGVNQLSNLPSDVPPSARSTAGLSIAEQEALAQVQLNQLEGLTRHMGGESQRLLEMESAPFFGPSSDLGEHEQVKSLLRERLKEWLVQNVVRSNQNVRDAEGRVLARRRQGAPAGARGTK